MNFIENIKEKNQFPILFIGSGITLRYFENAPNWPNLLLQLWKEVRDEKEFYSYINSLENQGMNDFEIYLKIADTLEREINEAFSSEKLLIGNLDNEKVYREKISAFRYLIANIFNSLKPKIGMEDEIESFAKMIIKARFIVTTNYDCFIENCFSSQGIKLDVKVGNSGLFERSNSYGELFKIHGSSKDVNSICITTEDYRKNESKLALVNAKILSNLTESPILFFGYSLTDTNVRELLATYSENLPFELSVAASRIGVVERTPNESRIVDVIAHESAIQMYYTQIKTDNYKAVYEHISQIDQGFLPSEIAKYENAVRRIIEIKGPTKGLNTILTSFEDLSTLTDEQIRYKNIVVALGDNRYLYRMPNYVDYVKDYFLDKSDMPVDIVLKFLAGQSLSTPIPIEKYISSVNRISEVSGELKKFERRQKSYTMFLTEAEKLSFSLKDEPLFANKSPLEIYHTTNAKEYSKLNYIIRNMKDFELEDVEKLILDILEHKADKVISQSAYRKLFMCYSIFHYFSKRKKP